MVLDHLGELVTPGPARRSSAAAPASARSGDALKRAFDVGVSAAALAVLAPVVATVAVAIRVRMGSPVLFRQVRPGRHGRPFVLIKFRTMLPPADEGEEAEEDFEARLTGLGRALRTSSLDELPQLLNILRGDLSLVGPRPLLTEYLGLYDEEQARRHDVRPGLTGLAQVIGRSTMPMEDRFRHDVWYVDHRSFGLDLQILARTVRCVLRRNGMSADGAPCLPAWTGTSVAAAVDPPAPRTSPDDHASIAQRRGRVPAP